ncbi:MAG: hypothetical protein MIO93_16970 [ANME-2 cluster archaeon]|nr:hypothetical protein [ANME-2 cluster archaeon]
MVEEHEVNKNVSGGTGITAGGDVSIGDNSGQVAIGDHISQTQTIGQSNLEELKKNLLEFQKGIARLGLSDEDESIIRGNMAATIKEIKKEKPVISKIKEGFESVLKTVKEAGKTINDISDLYEPAKKIATLLGIGLALL